MKKGGHTQNTHSDTASSQWYTDRYKHPQNKSRYPSSKPIRFPPVLENGLVLHGCGVRFIAAVFLAPGPARERTGVDEGSAAVVLCRVVREEGLC